VLNQKPKTKNQKPKTKNQKLNIKELSHESVIAVSRYRREKLIDYDQTSAGSKGEP